MLEVWKSSEGIFSNQGKYAMEILKRFDMLDCKSMATPMYTKMKLLSDETSKLVYMTQYRQIIESLIYLMNIRLNICVVVDTLSQYLVKTRCIQSIAAKNDEVP